jgi:hypothetical protein
MKICITGKYHHKNDESLIKICSALNLEVVETIEDSDVVCSPSMPLDASLHPNKKFIFGPHFSVLPEKETLLKINSNVHNNAIYIQPSKWVADFWMEVNDIIPITFFPFSVNIEMFKPNDDIEQSEKTEVFIYYKSRLPQELEFLENFLRNNQISYKTFSYNAKYDQVDYIKTLQHSKYGIWLGCHESQGFALEEALACNVPLLVWDVKSMNQEYEYDYDNIPATCIPYWDSRCGDFFYVKEDLQHAHALFLEKIEKRLYSPRDYVVENLSIEVCSSNFMKLINDIQIKS